MEPITVTCEVLRCDHPMPSGRMYPQAVVEKAVREYQLVIDRGLAFGPVIDGVIQLSKVAFIVQHIELKNDRVTIIVKSCNTPFGFSQRGLLEQRDVTLVPCGMGSVIDDIVQPDYILTGFAYDTSL